ncbi:MAG: DUF4079 domain-containing protein [Deltaproteobacteria bacterium]|nr:DUF4079 domain-containing protein [Deltaproteobacteria bacterium]MBW1848459.1 DUF4079 domain-containing protein [Deltaproteobacteria bacterium]
MFLIHPIFQSVGIIIALYVIKLGISRFRIVHLKQKTRFNWKYHVRFGITATTIWLVGILGGLYIVKTSWYGLFITGYHAKMAIFLIPFILFSISSGIYMDKRKKKRTMLPLIHAISNTVMLLLVLLQIYTGIGVYRTYVLGL